jgi:hypothetical protein
VLAAGTQILSVTFTPANTTNYRTVTGTVNLTVIPANLTITAANATKAYGTANPAFTGTVKGAVNADSFAEGFATTVTTLTPAGAYAIIPFVTGAHLADYTQSIANGKFTIAQAATKTSLKVSSASIALGQSVTLTATVSSTTSGSPSDGVEFYDGNALLATVFLSGTTATYATSSLALGQHKLTADYSGDTNFKSSNSRPPVIVTVTSANSSTQKVK